MNTVLLTIVGPDRRADVAAPSDTPVDELLPTFAQLTGGRPDAFGLVLGAPRRAPLDGDLTLADQGLVDGCILHLRPAGEAVREHDTVTIHGGAGDDGLTPAATHARGAARLQRHARPDPARRPGGRAPAQAGHRLRAASSATAPPGGPTTTSPASRLRSARRGCGGRRRSRSPRRMPARARRRWRSCSARCSPISAASARSSWTRSSTASRRCARAPRAACTSSTAAPRWTRRPSRPPISSCSSATPAARRPHSSPTQLARLGPLAPSLVLAVNRLKAGRGQLLGRRARARRPAGPRAPRHPPRAAARGAGGRRVVRVAASAPARWGVELRELAAVLAADWQRLGIAAPLRSAGSPAGSGSR